MKKLNKLFVVFIVGVLLLSCSDEWNDHFEEPITNSELGDNIYTYISADDKYSEFKELVDEVGLGDLLQENLEKTLFLPSNDIFKYDSKLDSLGKVQLVLNYLVAGSKYSNALNIPKLLAYNGKWLNLGVKDENRTISGVRFDYKTKVSNGLIYELVENYKTTPNLYEYIIELPNEYSKFREYVLDKNDTVFVLSESKPIGINSAGQTVYDSVFAIENTFISGANNVMIEDYKYTMFLPNNTVIDEAVEKVESDYLIAMGENMEESEVKRMENWCITSIFHRHLVDYTDFSKEQDVVLTNGNIYKVKDGLQELDPMYEECSNGRVYKTTHLHVPKIMYLPETIFDFWDARGSAEVATVNEKFFDEEGGKGEYYGWNNWGDSGWKGKVGSMRLGSEIGWGTYPNFVEFESWKRGEGDHEFVDATIIPGEYDVYLHVSSDNVWNSYSRMGDFRIEFSTAEEDYENEWLLLLERPTYNGNDTDEFTQAGQDGFAGRYVIPNEWGVNQLRFKITVFENNGSAPWGHEAYFSWVRFKPTPNNY